MPTNIQRKGNPDDEQALTFPNCSRRACGIHRRPRPGALPGAGRRTELLCKPAQDPTPPGEDNSAVPSANRIYPNALAAVPEGLWIAQQKISGTQRFLYDLPEPADPSEVCWLVDWNGKLLKTVRTDSRGTAGVAWDGQHLWTGADNNEIEGIFKTDLSGRTVGKHQIPLGMPANGGPCHGLLWQEGKLWITAVRMNGILRVDPETFAPEFYIPVNYPRSHGIAWDNGAIWIVVGNSNEKPEDYRGGLAKYDATTGRLLETVEFLPGSAAPHGLTMWNGVLYSCDAGIHPGWPNNWSKTTGQVFRIDLI